MACPGSGRATLRDDEGSTHGIGCVLGVDRRTAGVLGGDGLRGRGLSRGARRRSRSDGSRRHGEHRRAGTGRRHHAPDSDRGREDRRGSVLGPRACAAPREPGRIRGAGPALAGASAAQRAGAGHRLRSPLARRPDPFASALGSLRVEIDGVARRRGHRVRLGPRPGALDRAPQDHQRETDRAVPRSVANHRRQVGVRRHAHHRCRARAGQGGGPPACTRALRRAAARDPVGRQGSVRSLGDRHDMGRHPVPRADRSSGCGGRRAPRPCERGAGRQADHRGPGLRRHLVRRPDPQSVEPRGGFERVECRSGGRGGGRLRRVRVGDRDAGIDRVAQHALRHRRAAPDLRASAAFGRDGAVLVARQGRTAGPEGRGHPRGARGHRGPARWRPVVDLVAAALRPRDAPADVAGRRSAGSVRGRRCGSARSAGTRGSRGARGADRARHPARPPLRRPPHHLVRRGRGGVRGPDARRPR